MSRKFTIFSDALTNNSNEYILNSLMISNAKKFIINKLIIPTSFDCVSTTRKNNTLKIVGSTLITLTDGTYSISDMCAALQVALKIIDASFTVVYSSVFKSVTIARTTAFEIDLAASSIAPLIGFENTGTLTGASTYTSTKSYNPIGASSIIFCVDKFKYFIESGSNIAFSDFILAIPIYYIPDNTIIYEPKTKIEYKFINGTGLLTDIRFNFYFVDGSKIDFKGIPWMMEMEFE